jgi:putative FmdB family regulatory protein
MPLYEYACEECGHEFEALVFSGDEPECPACRSRKLHRAMSVPAQPRSTGASLPMGGCDPSLPPCGPACRRWPGNGG